MKTRIYNARILTMEENRDLFQGEIWTEGEKIVYVGEKKDTLNAWDREIDAEGNLILPGFKNAHTHSAMTFLRSYADDLPLSDWLNTQVFPMEAKLTEEDVYHLTRLAVMEYVTSGITACFDMYFSLDEFVRAITDCGFRAVLCGSINDYGGTVEGIEEEFLKFNRIHPLISYQLGFHAEYTTKRSIMEGIADLSRKYQAPVFCHNSETKDEVAGCYERYGTSPTAFLDSLGMFEYGGGGFHCVHMTDEDIRIFKEKGLSVVTNPASNVKLASGIAPLTRYEKEGINLAIGTDGPASNNCLDMFREMFLATGLQKIKEEDAAAMDASRVLYAATVGGARAMGLSDCDVLAEGKYADLILIDLHRPNMQPLNNIVKNLVYSGSKENVKLTMVNGKILYEKGAFYMGLDPEEVYAKANEIIDAKR